MQSAIWARTGVVYDAPSDRILMAAGVFAANNAVVGLTGDPLGPGTTNLVLYVSGYSQ